LWFTLISFWEFAISGVGCVKNVNIRGIGVVFFRPRDYRVCNMLMSLEQYQVDAVWPFKFVNQMNIHLDGLVRR
jgi:hypothetical protein